jgi:hypothetical protein
MGIMNPNQPNAAGCLGRRTIIIGDVNSGKTGMTRAIIHDLVAAGHGPNITLLDLAPETIRGIGGKLTPETPEIRYLTERIAPPRLMGKNDVEIQRLARQNASVIDALMHRAVCNAEKITPHHPILIINDASLYLQSGRTDRLLSLIRSYPTAIVNAYYGRSFTPTTFTARERKGVETIVAACDIVIRL